jgi:hypothetical protein
VTTRMGAVGFALLLAACGTPTGAHQGATFSGTVTGSQGGAISSATVTVTPAAGAALAAVETSSSGGFTVDNVPAGDGSITVSNVPSGCSTATAQYTGAKNGGNSIHNITVACSITLPSRVP